jgi:formate dehydrogenase iron-sulfur subunit
VVGEETALLNSIQGLRGTVSARPPFPAERGYHGLPTVVNNVETLCNAPFIVRDGAAAYAALSPDATPGTKLVCLNERFERPGVYEVRFGTPLREICDSLGGGLRDGRTVKALQIGGPLGGILPASELDTPFDFDPLARLGCMVGHGGIVAFDDRTDMRQPARQLLRFGAHESCGKCFPCRSGLTRALERATGAVIEEFIGVQAAAVLYDPETEGTRHVELTEDEGAARVYVITHIASGAYTADKFEREMQRNVDTMIRALVTEG